MRRSHADIAGGAVLLALMAALLVFTAGADYQMGPGAAYDAALMPRIWLIIAAFCAATLIVRGTAEILLARIDTGRLADVSPARFALAAAMTGTFVAAFLYAGYWPAMLVFVPAFSFAFGYRRVAVVLGAAVAFAGITWLVFAQLLMVRMLPWWGA